MNCDAAGLHRELAGVANLVFDLDGTLYDTRDFERPALAAVARWLRARSGLDLIGATEALWRRRESARHRPGLFQDLLREYGLPAEWGAECAQLFHQYPGDELKDSSSLKEVLTSFRSRQQRLALVSNGRVELQERKLRLLGLNELFDVMIFCDPGRPQELKPSLWAWQRLSSWLGNTSAIYIGDDPVDAAFAAAGGVRFVQFCFRSGSYED